jgi:hypothetical protein
MELSIKRLRPTPNVQQAPLRSGLQQCIVLPHVSLPRKASHRWHNIGDCFHTCPVICVAHFEFPFHDRNVRKRPYPVSPPVVVQIDGIAVQRLRKAILS